MDPARPMFSSKQPSHRLDQTDAQFVDVVHTTSLVLGQHKPIGNIDFYPNGGNTKQPGCRYDYGKTITTIINNSTIVISTRLLTEKGEKGAILR